MTTVRERTVELDRWIEEGDISFVEIFISKRVRAFRFEITDHNDAMRCEYYATTTWGGPDVRLSPDGSVGWSSGGRCDDATTVETAEAMAAIWRDVAFMAPKMRGHS